jgi:hypothetical protein
VSFSAGITGEWGSGKSTFLLKAKDEIGSGAYFVEFKPWNRNASKQIVDEFFENLRGELSKQHSSLAKPIRDYALELAEEHTSGWLKSAVRLFVQQSNIGLQAKKDKLSSRLSELEKPIVVAIDDLDRLEGNEIFEILRLIRNTGDLKNVIYLVAYDKEYVTHMLLKKGIDRPDEYLEKIFNIELHLPKVETYHLWETFRKDLTDMLINGNPQELVQFTFEEIDLFISCLGNYRKIKRFARLIVLNVSYIREFLSFDVNLHDFILLELIQIYDKTVYDDLFKNRFRYLTLASSSNVYSLQKEFHNIEFRPITLKLLKALFSGNAYNSIRRASAFAKYFSLGILPTQVSEKEFLELLNTSQKETLCEIINRWKIDEKDENDLIAHYDSYNVKKIGKDELKSYIWSILYIMEVLALKNSKVLESLRTHLLLMNYNRDNRNHCHQVAQSWMEWRIKKSADALSIASMLNTLYISNDSDGQLIYLHQNVLYNEGIKNLLILNAQQYLDDHQDLSCKDILITSSELGKIIKKSCVRYSLGNSNTIGTWVNWIIDVLIQFFSNKERMSSEEYESLKIAMFQPRAYDPSFGLSEDQWENNELENIERSYQMYFGTDIADERRLKEAITDN